MTNSRRMAAVLLSFMVLSLFSFTAVSAAPQFANPLFKGIWEYSDKRVDEIPGAGRGYTWGPNSFGTLVEDYAEAPTGKRQVQYFDKSRMEVSPSGLSVTNGLLTKELVTGSRQDGDAKFTKLTPSTVQVAGDDNSGGGNAVAPAYASFKGVVTFNPGENTATNQVGKTVNQSIDKAGEVKTLDNPPAQVVFGAYEALLGHNIPQVFLDFQNLTGLVWNAGRQSYQPQQVYTDNPTANVFGYAITEPFWARAVVAGAEKDVLIQLYERRVLTYTPSNPPEFRVEMGNIGQHYYQWRYGQAQPNPTPTPTTAPVNNSASCTVDKPAVSASLTINASLALPNVSGGNQTLCVAANKNGQPVAGAKVGFKVVYKSVTRDFVGNDTGTDGKSTTSWDVGGPSKGFEIKVNVTVTAGGETATTQVSWTPQ